MKCPECGAEKMRVCVTNDYGDVVERVRMCRDCRAYYVTNEKEIRRRGNIAQS
jgi:transcriptional regulator NrdR family protein